MIVAFCGLKTSGKSTAADVLIDEYGFKRLSFAYSLKKTVVDLFELTWEQVTDPVLKETIVPKWGLTPRQIMQKFGTEVGRRIHEDIWIIKSMKVADENPNQDYVFDDCRFLNEALHVKKRKGTIVGVDRPGLSVDDHKSEKELFKYFELMCDMQIANDSSKEAFEKRVNNLFKNSIIPAFNLGR